MIHLIYVSSATKKMSHAQLLSLLEQSRKRNKRQNVTGMLLHADRNFFQVLEGKKTDVEEIYQSIINDDRNKGNIVITKEKINERTFPDWSMGFNHLNNEDIIKAEGFSDFFYKEPEDFMDVPKNIVMDLLLQFKENIPYF